MTSTNSRENFIVELGTEELPPKTLRTLSNSFSEGIISSLEQAKINFSSAQTFATPRRLALLITGISTYQPDQMIEKRGPAISAAYDSDGNPSKAALGFARSNQVEVSALEQEKNHKGAWLVYRSIKQGPRTTSLLPKFVLQALTNLPIPKRMRWGTQRTSFVRPAHWLLMMMGKEVINCEIFGIKSDCFTYGHRFHANLKLPIYSPTDYEKILNEQGMVIANFDLRRESIKKQVQDLAKKDGGIAVIDEELLTEVTALNEWPVALRGQFDKAFLEIPSEALIASMKSHQKYFHIINEHNSLLPYFITISNIDSSDPQQVVRGNEMVIRPRLADSKFFYETDKKSTQDDRRERLKSIIFQSELGSLYDKSERISVLSAYISSSEGGEPEVARRAGQICKSDLVSEMVLEFPELQGIMGQYYAQHDGEPQEICKTQNDHYMPRFSGDQLPSSLTGCAVAIADKIDTIVGIFGIGQIPTGSRDPFALRRASIGILRIIVEKALNLDLMDLVTKSISCYQTQGIALPELLHLDLAVVDYMLERFDAAYQEQGIQTNIINSVKALRPTQPLDFDLRINAISHFSDREEAAALSSANKRVSNILSKAGDINIPDKVDENLLIEPAEIDLALLLTSIKIEVEPALKNRLYSIAMESFSSLKEPIDLFFNHVLVNSNDEPTRLNRYALLKQLRELFLCVADISILQD